MLSFFYALADLETQIAGEFDEFIRSVKYYNPLELHYLM